MVLCLLLSCLLEMWGCTDALLTISHHLQKSLDAGMIEFYIVQLDFRATFDRVSYSGLLIKFKSIGVDGIMLFICNECLSNRRQRVVVVRVTSVVVRFLLLGVIYLLISTINILLINVGD